MFGFITRRISVLLVILLGSSFLIYNLEALAGDPLEELRISKAPNAKQQMLVLTRDLQLDVPPPIRFFNWLKGVLGIFVGDFDLGKTRTGEPVGEAITAAIPTTIRLVLGATILAIVLGITIGIITALRQYSRFDYSMTFVSFLFFSLPIFWVAVLLKQYLAIGFNNFLADPTVTMPWLFWLSLASGIFWAGIIGGERRKVWIIFFTAFASSALALWLLDTLDWFTKPALGPGMVLVLGIGVAVGVTQISMGISNRRALYASLAVAVLGFIIYFPIQSVLNPSFDFVQLLLLAAATIVVSWAIGWFSTKIDRSATVRTTVITGVLVAGIILVDKIMRTWYSYSSTDAINFRPVPTIGQVNTLLVTEDFWFLTLDSMLHLFLPTMALMIISFAGYVRYSRGSLLEVLNQDYIRTARAKGLTERTVIMRHAFRNALIPLTTIMAFDFAGIIGGAIITEKVFGWVGMGTLFNQAIGGQDLNLLMGVFFVTASMALLANLAADLIYSALDPRIRVGK
ncbi:MAG: ABC transporter permease [Micrococcales bacterium]